jgi:hypothetical protein
MSGQDGAKGPCEFLCRVGCLLMSWFGCSLCWYVVVEGVSEGEQ